MALVVRLPDGRTLRFSTSFYIGREPGSDVELADGHVSRRHAEVSPSGGGWIIRDLQSSNGLLVDGRRVESAAIGDGVSVTVGAGGPTIRIEPQDVQRGAATEPESSDEGTLDELAERYFRSGDDDSVGGRTLMIRKAFQKVQQRQRRRQRVVVAAIAVVALVAGAYALYAHRVMQKQTERAEAFFYEMKAQDVAIADLERKLAESGNSALQQQVAAYLEDRRRMQSNYENFVADLYDRKLNDKERVIMRVTRLFGECDVAAPRDYVGEVMRYIKIWQSTGRFVSAIERAQKAGYPPLIVQALAEQQLPKQYFYLAMQESDFDPTRSGPPTRWGFAKGMWQFIPDTGRRYGLNIGPRANEPVYDPLDDRLAWEKATRAAARYIKDIYSTDAQASGLLVMASYNWGEVRIIDRLKQMPKDPRQRNFWKLLEQHQVPPQTYGYVFSIVSAAVIGEDPRLFGFKIDNPLAFAGQH